MGRFACPERPANARFRAFALIDYYSARIPAMPIDHPI